MARLGISAEFVRHGLVGGTEQALHYTIDGLIANARPDDCLVIVGTGTPFKNGPQVQIVDPPRRSRVRFLQETLSYRALASSLDAYYFPNYFTPAVRRRCRTVATIPDLQYLHLPANFSRRKRAWLRLAHRHTLRRADVVTVYSEFVRQDIAEHYGDRAVRKATVLPIPVSWDRFGDAVATDSYALRQRPYVLAVSSHYKHKNLATLLRAFQRVHEIQPELELILVGQLGAQLIGVRQAEDVVGTIHALGLEGTVRATGFVDVHELGELYRGAQLFVFPSVFEGFGLPPVEALGFGLPVITTKRTSLPEVTRGLADYVNDPFDDEELAALMLERLSDGKRPSSSEVSTLREFYAPKRIGAALHRILTNSG
jgi:glycosyltransferase involved in cell wall biosynthesis